MTQALAAQPSVARRVALATAVYLAYRSSHDLTPAAWEPLSQLSRRVVEPRSAGASVAPGPQLETWRQINAWLATQDGTALETRLERNYLLGGFPDLWDEHDWKDALACFRRDLRRFGAVEPTGGPA